IFTREELIEKFSIEGIGKTAGVFPADKLLWLNFERIKAMEPAVLADHVRPFVERAGLPVPAADRLAEICRLQQDRARTLKELVEISRYFFVRPEIDPKAGKKFLTREARELLQEARGILAAAEDFSAAGLEAPIRALSGPRGVGLGKIAQPLRVAVTGGTASP